MGRRRYILKGPDGLPIETFTTTRLAQMAFKKAPEGCSLVTETLSLVGHRNSTKLAIKRWEDIKRASKK